MTETDCFTLSLNLRAMAGHKFSHYCFNILLLLFYRHR